MARPFRTLLISLAFAAIAGGALAADYIVVGSTDPAIARGSAYDAGARIALASGRTVTLMQASGQILTLKGGAGGATLPSARAAPRESERMAVLKLMLAPPPPVTGNRMTKTRSGGFCPGPEALLNLDNIVLAHQGGCKREASAALETYIVAHTPPE